MAHSLIPPRSRDAANVVSRTESEFEAMRFHRWLHLPPFPPSRDGRIFGTEFFPRDVPGKYDLATLRKSQPQTYMRNIVATLCFCIAQGSTRQGGST